MLEIQTEKICKCVECNKESLHTIIITLKNFDGFCHSSNNEHICRACLIENTKLTSVGEFLKIKNDLYHSPETGLFKSYAYEKVRNKAHLDRIFKQEYYDMLNMLEDKN